MVIGSILFLKGCHIEHLNILLAFGWLLAGLSFPTMALTSSEPTRERECLAGWHYQIRSDQISRSVRHNWATEQNWLTDTCASVIVCENMCVCVCKHGELTCVCVICLQLEWDWERAGSQHSETIMNIFPEVSLCFRSWGVNTYFTK